MEQTEYDYFHQHLMECDPDYVVDVLEITTEDLLFLFSDRARAFIEREHG